MGRQIGIAVIVSTPEEYSKVQDFLTRDVAWVDWHDNMYKRETAIVLKANKNSDYSSGAVGCAKGMRIGITRE